MFLPQHAYMLFVKARLRCCIGCRHLSVDCALCHGVPRHTVDNVGRLVDALSGVSPRSLARCLRPGLVGVICV